MKPLTSTDIDRWRTMLADIHQSLPFQYRGIFKGLEEDLRQTWLQMIIDESRAVPGQPEPEVKLDGLGLPYVWYPMQVSRIVAKEAPKAEQTSTFNGIPTHCPACKAEYKHFAHPRTGAIMTSTCECKFRYVHDGNGNTIMVQEPPADAG